MVGTTTWRAASTVVLVAVLARPLVAAEPPGQHREEKLQERNRCCNEAFTLRAAGKRAEALAALHKALLLQRQLDPTDSTADVIILLERMALVQEEQEDWRAAVKSRAEVLPIRARLQGEKHWQVTDARLALAHAERLASLGRAQRLRLQEAASLNDRTVALADRGQLQEALPLAERVLAIRKEMLGAEHPDTLRSLCGLGWVCRELRQYERAEAAYEQAQNGQQKVLGAGHPDYALTLNNRGGLHQVRGEYARAEPLFHQAADIYRLSLGEQSPRYLASLDNLISLYNSAAARQEGQEDFAPARRSRQQALEWTSKRYGEKHWRTTDARLALAAVEAQSRLSREQRARLRQRVDLDAKRLSLSRSGKYREAVEPARQGLEITAEVLGEETAEFARRLHTLAQLHNYMGGYARAESLYRQALALRKELLGEGHPDYATSLNNLACLYRDMGDCARAVPLMRQARDIRKQALGEKHSDYAVSLHNLASLYRELGDFTRAEPLFLQATALVKESLGEKNPDYATSLTGLAYLYDSMGDYAAAERLYRQARDIRKEVLGEKHPRYASSLRDLAALYTTLGDYARAEPLYQQARDIVKEAQGEKHSDYATSLLDLAALYRAMGDYARAEPLYRQARDISHQALGRKHPDYGRSLNSLALLYGDMGEYDQAEPLLLEAHDIAREALGKKHPFYLTSLNNLAALYYDKGDYVRAEPLYREALALRKEKLGVKHPDYADSLLNLANLYKATDYPGAEPLYRQARDLYKERLGEKHPHYAHSLFSLAKLYSDLGDHARAEPLYRQALTITRQSLQQSAGVQSERQQMNMAANLRHQLDSYLSCVVQAQAEKKLPDDAPTTLYGHILAWKGAVFTQQRRLRLQRLDPELTDDFARLEKATARLATLAFATPTPQQRPAWLEQVQDLTEHKERLESRLQRRSAAFRKEQALARLSPAQLQASLPSDCVLVDLLEYRHFRRPLRKGDRWRNEQRVAAFIVRPQSLRLLDLGALEPIAAAVTAWRQQLERRQATSPAAATLRRLVWDQLEEHLRGAQTVLLSPDGDLARMPWAALPGSKPGTYLLEERALAVVAVPQLLPELLERRAGAGGPSLLLVGDVDFDAQPGRPQQAQLTRAVPRSRSGTLLHWGSLPGTGTEVNALEKIFHSCHPGAPCKRLEASAATEGGVRHSAEQHRYVHLATHGFFAPAEVRSALAPSRRQEGPPLDSMFARQGISGCHPQLLSGVVLAGANQPVQTERDDGILTALEVGGLQLSGVELVTLSACETGLGQTAGGEGLLGLQRAFQMAGARAVAASLWKVPDQATALLMERFYDNLWQKKMSKLEALRQAQLWLLRDGPKQPGLARGLDLPEDEQPRQGGALPPYYWAAFVLSGDWR